MKTTIKKTNIYKGVIYNNIMTINNKMVEKIPVMEMNKEEGIKQYGSLENFNAARQCYILFKDDIKTSYF